VVSWEAIRAAAPDVLLVMPCGFEVQRTLEEMPLLCRQRGFEELPAVRHGRVYVLDGNAYFNRSGPRMVDSLELLAHLLHPQHFPLPPQQGDAPAYRRWPAGAQEHDAVCRPW
jgi:iron complex transport system substrate-binding protein